MHARTHTHARARTFSIAPENVCALFGCFQGDKVRPLQDFGDDGALYRSIFGQIFQFVQNEYPENLQFVEEYAPKAFDRQVNEKTPQNTDKSPSPKRSMRSKFKTWLKRL